MPSLPVVLFHIFAGIVALSAGAAAMTFRKGSPRHRLSGTVFSVAMLSMSATGAYRAFVKDQPLNVVAGLLTLYLITTAWVAGRRRDTRPGAFDLSALAVALFVGTGAILTGVGAASGSRGGEPAALFVFGTVALLFVVSDTRMFLRGGLSGAQRIARHLWRMGLALFIAAASLYPGQAQLFPASLRETNLLLMPLVLIIGSAIFWIVRVSFPSGRRLRSHRETSGSRVERAPLSPTRRQGEEMRTIVNALRTFLIPLAMCSAVALAQDAPKASDAAPKASPFTAHSRGMYGGLQKILLRAAQSMPEEHYEFMPVESVRTYGQIVGHVADAQYLFCSIALGVKNPAPKVETTKATKADLTAALEAAFAYCNQAYEGMTDESAAQLVKLMGSEQPRLGTLTVNQMHTIEHYGNLVTYMRMKGIVPPTSDPEFMKGLMR